MEYEQVEVGAVDAAYAEGKKDKFKELQDKMGFVTGKDEHIVLSLSGTDLISMFPDRKDEIDNLTDEDMNIIARRLTSKSESLMDAYWLALSFYGEEYLNDIRKERGE